MDAFPDYTKFDQTHKVLAAIQVISDTTEAEEETREVCHPAGNSISVVGDDNLNADIVSFTYDNDSTDDKIKITATGLDAVKDFTKSTFPQKVQDEVVAMQLNFELPIEADKKYRIKQYNPVFSKFPQDGFIKREGTQWVRDKTYAPEEWEAEPKNTLEVLVSNLRGPISISVFEVPEDGASSKLVKTIDINNQVYFKEEDDD